MRGKFFTMKRFLILFSLVVALCSCGESKKKPVDVEKLVETTVAESLRSRMKNPDSFKIESIEIKKDTVPYYFDNEILSIAEDLGEALEDCSYYADKSSYWYEEKMEALRQVESLSSQLLDAIEVAKFENEKNPMVEYVVCLSVSGENSYGNRVSNDYICIVDHNDTSRMLCTYDVDEDFYKPVAIVMLFDEEIKARMEKDRFGNYDSSKLSFVEQFILN